MKSSTILSDVISESDFDLVCPLSQFQDYFPTLELSDEASSILYDALSKQRHGHKAVNDLYFEGHSKGFVKNMTAATLSTVCQRLRLLTLSTSADIKIYEKKLNTSLHELKEALCQYGR